MKIRKVLWCLLGCNIIFTVSCATIDGDKQSILVRTKPPGGKIVYGDRSMGTAPKYIKVERDRKGLIEIHGKAGEVKRVNLYAEYRWKDSFFSNLIFLTAAPVGWFVDLGTGNSWSFKDPKKVNLKDSLVKKEDKNGRKIVVAVAPPSGEDEMLSDSLGRKLSQHLSETKPSWKVIPYNETKKMFNTHGIYNGYFADSDDLRNLYGDLNAERGVEVVIQPTYQLLLDKRKKNIEDIELKLVVKNILNLHEKDKLLTVSPNDVPYLKEGGWTREFKDWFNWLPNTISFDFSGNINPRFDVTENDQKSSIQGEGRVGNDLFSKSLNLIGNFGLSHFEPRSRNSYWRFRFGFVPKATVSLSNIRYPSIIGIEDIEYERWNFSAGYGVKGSYFSKWGDLYLTVVPALTYTYVSWDQNGESLSRDDIGVTAITEIGYNYFINNNWTVRIFNRSVGESVDAWTSAITKSLGREIEFDGVFYTYSGISIGYYFPAADHPLQNISD